MTNFAKELKVGTKKSHTAAENTAFVKSFLRGVVSPDNYKCLVSDLYFVYKALEEEVYGLRTHPIVGSLYFPELERLIALEKDLQYFYGLDWRTKIEPSQACKQYVNRIREVAEDEPELLVGHHYTRYLGDLSGGQILKNIAKKAMNLEKAGLDPLYDCQRGDCGICQCEVISGTPDHRDIILTEEEKASNSIMQICVSRAKSKRLVIDI